MIELLGVRVFLLFLACFAAGFFASGGSRAGSGNSVALAWILRTFAHVTWLFLFKDLVAKNILNIPDFLFYLTYIIGYSAGQSCIQYIFIKFVRGKASVGGIDALSKRLDTLEKNQNEAQA